MVGGRPLTADSIDRAAAEEAYALVDELMEAILMDFKERVRAKYLAYARDKFDPHPSPARRSA